jgi:hypothetical protein
VSPVTTADRCTWLLLIHQLPHKPAYLRVKAGRRLARVGAIPLKSSVYVLPNSDGALEDFQWIRREMLAGGGDATIVEADLVEGLTDAEVQESFRAARDLDFVELSDEARRLSELALAKDDELPDPLEADVARLEKRLAEISAIDFFGASQREAAAGLVGALRTRLQPKSARVGGVAPERPLAATWVTRTGVHVDRIASAWLIRRFIDADAVFKFVPAKGYVPRTGELRFDMYEAEFTHEGDRCTFETLCARFRVQEPGLEAIAEMVHDIDLKDGKYDRPETAGLATTLVGICLAERQDEARLRRGFELFDALLLSFARKTDKRRDS